MAARDFFIIILHFVDINIYYLLLMCIFHFLNHFCSSYLVLGCRFYYFFIVVLICKYFCKFYGLGHFKQRADSLNSRSACCAIKERS